MKTAAFVTLGCKINQYESEAIREQILKLGYTEVPRTSPADVYVVNTCSVTATSGVKSRKYVQRAARTNPEARILVVGCSTPSEKALLARIPQVAVVAGNEEKTVVARYLDGGWTPGEAQEPHERDVFRLRISGYAHRTRANVKVQDGCNSFCSFCVIPFLRGRSTSRRPGDVVDEVRRLVRGGYREVVITGVHLQEYGVELDPPITLAALLARVAEVDGVRRIRLSSTNPRAFTPELLEVLQAPIFCPHWHIPLQAGADTVLSRMRRDYRIDDFRRLVADLRGRFEHPSIATDVIVGYPGESVRDFEQTLAVCREFGFSKVHAFPYSVREGTLASKLGGNVEPGEIRRRARVLRELDAGLHEAYGRAFLDSVVEVLVEGPAEEASGEDLEHGALEGLTERYVRVRFPSPSARARERFLGTFQPVRLTRVSPRVEGQWCGEVSPDFP